MTEKELLLVQDKLNNEELLVKKFTEFCNMTTDMELKNQFSAIAKKHQNHYNTLINHINNAASNIKTF